MLAEHYAEWERMAQEQNARADKLSTEVKVERGAAPGAGFERRHKRRRRRPRTELLRTYDFLSSIAAARQEVQALFEISQDLGNSLSLDETLSVLAVRLAQDHSASCAGDLDAARKRADSRICERRGLPALLLA